MSGLHAEFHAGMTLRDWFAATVAPHPGTVEGLSLEADLRFRRDGKQRSQESIIAEARYKMADAMLAERAKREGR